MTIQGDAPDRDGSTPSTIEGSDALLRALVDTVLFHVCVLEANDRGELTFLFLNVAQEQFLGVAVGALIGHTLSEVAGPHVVALWRAKCREAQEHRQTVSFEFAGSSMHPGYYTVSVTYLGDSARGRPRFGLLAMDITDRRRLEQEVSDALARARASAEETARKNHLLEREIEERRRTEEILRRQREEILTLSTPLIEVADGVLALPVVGRLDAERTAHLMDKLLQQIVGAGIRVTILDLTGVSEVDSATAGHLVRVARAVGLLGSRCVLSGISPRIAQTMTTSGISAEGIATFGTLKDALGYALSRRG